MWTDLEWFIFQLEVRICFWSSAAWPATSCTWAFPLCILGYLWRTDTIVFSKLNKPPPLKCPPSLLSPPSNGFEINKPPPHPPEELNRGFAVFPIISHQVLNANLVSSLAPERQLPWLCKQGKSIKIKLTYNQQRTDECTMNEWI